MTTLTRLLAAFLVAALAGACTTAPGTGRTIFTGGMSQEQESQLGFREHPKVLAEFGGEYKDPALKAYVASIGEVLARSSELPDLDFTFTVLDTPIVNAFALPGGYVYVTRGLMALARDEAELAGVMAHEIGHVTARHSAERHGQSLAATIANIGVAVLAGGQAAQASSTVSGLVLRSYSRDQEFESDTLGGRYLSRTGYDVGAMAGFLSQLQAHSRLEATLSGNPGGGDEFNIMQTHPRTADRIRQATQQAAAQQQADPIRARDIYLSKINGMLYGDNPDQGFIDGQTFSHPKLRFTFKVPKGFRLYNGARQVAAKGPNGAVIVFDQEPKGGYRGDLRGYVRDVWAKGIKLQGLEAIEVNGLRGATAVASNNTRAGPRDFRLVAIRFDANTIYRFVFVTPPNMTRSLAADFRRTTYSFKRLTPGQAAAMKPRRIALYRVRSGDTPQRIAQRMAYNDYKLERFLALNGLSRGAGLQAGQTVKIVVK